MSHTKDYYKILGISPEAEDVVIRASYKALSQKYHPDKFDGSSTFANDKMAELNEAVSILSDPEKRKEYDQANFLESENDTWATSDSDKSHPSNNSEIDPLYDEAVHIVLGAQRVSASLVKRQLNIGYNRAARLIEEMERAGIVSPMRSDGHRDILIPLHSQKSRPQAQEKSQINTQATSPIKWKRWVVLYLAWVVGYLILANMFLIAPEVTVAKDLTAPQPQQVSPERKEETPPDENTVIMLATKLSSQGEEQARRAFGILQPLADKGNPLAQYQIALMYFDGIGTLQANDKGESFLKMAAQQGLPDAIFDLATRFESGNGVMKDSHSARVWYAELEKIGDRRGNTALEKLNNNQPQQSMSSPTEQTSPNVPTKERIHESSSLPENDVRPVIANDSDQKIPEQDGSVTQTQKPCPIPGINC